MKLLASALDFPNRCRFIVGVLSVTQGFKINHIKEALGIQCTLFSYFVSFDEEQFRSKQLHLK